MSGEHKIIHITDPAWLEHLKSLCLGLPRSEQAKLVMMLLINLGLDEDRTSIVAQSLSDLTS